MPTVSYTPTPIDVTPRQLAGLVDHSILSNVPLMTWGDPGLGKTQITKQRIEKSGRRYADFRAAILDVPDLQGYPITALMQRGEPCPMTAAPGLPPPESSEAWGIVFEELPGCSRMMQGALYGMILERNGLPTDCRVFATGNPASSRGVYVEQPAPLKTRFRHCRLILCPDESLAYAQANGWHPYTTAYHTMTKGTDWSNFDASSKEETYACPRSWEDISKTLHAGAIPADLMTPMICGSLGYGIGQKFSAFIRLYADLAPTVAAMRTDPANAPIPEDSAAQWFIAATIAAAKAEANANPAGFADWALVILSRMTDELCVFAVNALTRHTPQIGRTPSFINSFARNPRYAALAQFCK